MLDHNWPSLEFQVAVAPTAAFLSQLGIFALSLKELGPPYSTALIHVSIGDERMERGAIPREFGLWECREQLRWHWVEAEEIARLSYFALGWNRFRVLGESEVVFMCDVDTLFVRRVDELLRELRSVPAMLGVPVHLPQFHVVPGQTQAGRWRELSRILLGYEMALPCRCTLHRHGDDEERSIPFCPNFGVVAGPASFFHRIGEIWEELRRGVMAASPPLSNGSAPPEHFFSGQIALALAIVRLGLPWRQLPMRYNWPNEKRVDELYPDEIPHVRILHYLRGDQFQRHRIFCDPIAFEEFLEAPGVNSGNRLLRERVRQLTGGQFLGGPGRYL